MLSPRPHLFGLLAGLFLAVALCFASLVIAGAWTRIAESQVINVTGSARKNVRADLVIWRANFSADAETLLEAQSALKADLEKVMSWLVRKGIKDAVVQPIQIREVTARVDTEQGSSTRRVGYRLVQPIEVRSTDVALVPRLGSESTDLLEQGVTFMSDGLEFIYTAAGDAKIEMMAEATRDARARADQMASQGGRAVKELRNARMGVVQINPLYSTATSWEGNNDTSSVDKTITATVSATFSLK